MTTDISTIDVARAEPTTSVAPDAPAPASDAEPTTEPIAAEPARPRTPNADRLQPVARPAKFLADLTRAMRTAAQAERDETLAQHVADATSFVEQLRAESAERATSLRQLADEDIVGIRDWSKAELARIREETERRIAERRTALEQELEEETERAERLAASVGGRVEAYRTEMDRFFEHLLTIDDPATFAALAANLPEPPAFDAPATGHVAESLDQAAVEAAAVSEQAVAADPATELELAAEPEVRAEPEAAAEPEASKPEPAAQEDPRVAALASMSDFAAAESEAGAGLDPLAFLGVSPAAATPDAAESDADPTAIATTRLLVTGLVSVAGIASFKRQIARRPGVQSVTVSSAPDGEFIFTVVHRAGVDLPAAIPALEGFSATVSGVAGDEISITAHDPEAAA